MSQFQNETFQFDLVKYMVQILRQSVTMATNLSFHFICKLLCILESFILSNQFQLFVLKLTILKKELLTL